MLLQLKRSWNLVHAHALEAVASFLCELETGQAGKGKERLSPVQKEVLPCALLQSQASSMQANNITVTRAP